HPPGKELLEGRDGLAVEDGAGGGPQVTGLGEQPLRGTLGRVLVAGGQEPGPTLEPAHGPGQVRVLEEVAPAAPPGPAPALRAAGREGRVLGQAPAPRRAAGRRQGELRRRPVGPRTLATERGDGDHDEGGTGCVQGSNVDVAVDDENVGPIDERAVFTVHRTLG